MIPAEKPVPSRADMVNTEFKILYAVAFKEEVKRVRRWEVKKSRRGEEEGRRKGEWKMKHA